MSFDGAQIITFYSYKGGTGRTMHLANVAWILASNAQRVLVVDWDFEAPGLHRYFRPFLVDKDLAATDGLIDLIWDFADAAMTPVPEAERTRGWHEEYADLLRCTAAVRWRWPTPGRLDLLPAGRQSSSYSRRVNSFNWQNFYDRLGGGVFLESVKDRMRKEYDYVLIDSRTGVSDTAGICTVQMPDALVLCFTANNQSIEGCAAIAHSVREQWAANAQRSPDCHRILPLLTRVDGSEKDKLNGRRSLARSRFDSYVASLSASGSIDDYWRDTEVPYVPWYSYEEVGAAFADKYKEKNSILDSAEALTRVLTRGEITSLMRPSDEERARVLSEFAVGGDAVPDTLANRGSQVVTASPYPGLRPFASQDTTTFFGRNDEIEHLIARLRAGERELYVIGPSGSGKTSLLCAGLIPLLEREPERVETRFLIRLLRPGMNPFTTLSAVFEMDTAIDIPQLSSAVERLLEHHATCTRVMLVIDQLEELFAMADGFERSRCIDAIHALRADPRVVLLLVLRSDYYGALLESRLSEGLAGRIPRMQVDPLHGDALRKAIVGPARAVGTRIEPALVERLIADVKDQPGSLPLLQVILGHLWHRCRGDVLTAAHYTELGGLGMLAEHADFVRHKLARAEEATALRILLRLVHFGEGRADTRRQQTRGALLSAGSSVVAFDSVLQQLVDSRLVTVTRDDEHGEVLVDLAHEALLQVWPTLAEWIHTRRVREQQRREFEAAATTWRTYGSGSHGLLEGSVLAAALTLRASASELGLSTDLIELLRWSEIAHFRAMGRYRRLSQMLFTGAALLALVALWLSFNAVRQDHPSIEQYTEDDHRLAVTGEDHQSSPFFQFQEIGRQLLLDEHSPQRALPYLVEARSEKARAHVTADDDEPGLSLRLLFGQAVRGFSTLTIDHQSITSSATFSADGTRIAISNDDTARVWDATTGNPLSPPLTHHGIVRSAAFSFDGTRVVTASDDRTARVWDATSGQPLSPPLVHNGAVRSAVFSFDGTRIVTASDDGTARVWDATTGNPLSPPLTHHGIVRSAAFSFDGLRVVTASDDKTARVWDATTGNPFSPPFTHQGIVRSAAFNFDGTRVVTASDDNTARVWQVATGKPLTRPLTHQAPINSAAFSTDGKRVVTSSLDETARVWDAVTGTPLMAPLEHQAPVNSAAFSTDGVRVVTASRDGIARVWDAATGKPLAPSFDHQAPVNSAAFSTDGNRVVTAGRDGTVRIWEVVADKTVPQLVHQDLVTSVAFSRDGARIVTASRDRTARVWDAATGAPMSPPLRHNDGVVSASFSTDGTRVVTASLDGTARVWDTATGMPVSRPFTHEDRIVSAMFSPDGTHIVTASRDETAHVWDIATSLPVSPPLKHSDGVVSAMFSSDGTRVVTASRDWTARVWDVATGLPVSPPLKHENGVVSAMFNPDGTCVVTASLDGTARVWDSTTGLPVSPPLTHEGSVNSAAFSPDGTRVLTASVDHTARVWDARTGKQLLARPIAHWGNVMSATFSSDGTCIITASSDHTVQIWDAISGRPLAPSLLHQDSVTTAIFSYDGKHVLTSGADGVARIWTLPLASGTLAEWTTAAERASPYVLRGGALSTRIHDRAPIIDL